MNDEKDHSAALLPGDALASPASTEPLPDKWATPIQWVDPDGTVFASLANKYLTVTDLITLLERVQPENRSLPLRFSVRWDSETARSVPLSLVTRPQFSRDVADGEKAVFLTPARDRCGLNFVFTADTEYAIAVSGSGSDSTNAERAEVTRRSEAP